MKFDVLLSSRVRWTELKSAIEKAVEGGSSHFLLASGAEAARAIETRFRGDSSLDLVAPAAPFPLRAVAGKRIADLTRPGWGVRIAFLRELPISRAQSPVDLALQAAAAGGRMEVTARRRAVFWAGLGACAHFRCQAWGLLYDRKFDLGKIPYAFKPSPLGSHHRLMALVPDGARVLDLGCGAGWIGERLAARGCRVEGVDVLPETEVSPGLAAYHRIDLDRSPRDLLPVIARFRPEVVLMGDLLEHLADPEGLLDLLHESLPADTKLVASTGNVAFLVVRSMLLLGQFNYGPRGILDRTHRRLFTRKSFRTLFEGSGFRVMGEAGVPMPFSSLMGGAAALWLERLNALAARLRPGLFAYQFVFSARRAR